MIGTGPGPTALLTEFIALKVAAATGLPVPTAKPLYLPPSFPWMKGTDEFDGAVQRSFGWNLGIAIVDDARPAMAEEIPMADPVFLKTLSAVDSPSKYRPVRPKPNVLSSPRGLVAIDFDACLFLRRAILAGEPKDSALWADHILSGFDLGPAQMIPCEAVDVAIEEAPGEWIEIGFNRDSLLAALQRYTAAWNEIAAAESAVSILRPLIRACRLRPDIPLPAQLLPVRIAPQLRSFEGSKIRAKADNPIKLSVLGVAGPTLRG